MQTLYQAGDAAFYANVGSLVEPLTVEDWKAGIKRVPRSVGAHNQQQKAAQNLDADRLTARGVMGRMLDALDRDGFNAVGYSLGGLVKALDGSGDADVVDLTGGVNKFVEFERLQQDIEAVIGKNMSENVFAETYASLLGPAFSTAAEIAETFAAAQLSTAFPETDLGRDFANIARIIAQRDALGLERGAFYLDIGGFDNHNSLEALPPRLQIIDDAVAAFAAELTAQGVFDDVVLASASDFGRTLTWNGLGTDHAWGGHSFVVGGGLKEGKVLGHYPNTLGPDGEGNIRPDRGRIIPAEPWEGVWNPITGFMDVPAEERDYVLPNAKNFPGLLTKEDVFAEATPKVRTPAPSTAPGSATPTLAPTTAAPSVTAPTSVPTTEPLPPIDSVCNGETGNFPLAGGTLHCREVDGEIVNWWTKVNKNMARTCKRADANSCPAGFNVWVPRSHAHAEAVYDEMGATYTELVGVTHDVSKNKCNEYPLNSDAQAACAATGDIPWRSTAPAGEPWFVREEDTSTFTNYAPGCWIKTYGLEDHGRGFVVNDNQCGLCFRKSASASETTIDPRERHVDGVAVDARLPHAIYAWLRKHHERFRRHAIDASATTQVPLLHEHRRVPPVAGADDDARADSRTDYPGALRRAHVCTDERVPHVRRSNQPR